MIDLSLFRALEQSRKTIEEEFKPVLPPRLASEVSHTTPKRLRAKEARQPTLVSGETVKGF